MRTPLAVALLALTTLVGCVDGGPPDALAPDIARPFGEWNAIAWTDQTLPAMDVPSGYEITRGYLILLEDGGLRSRIFMSSPHSEVEIIQDGTGDWVYRSPPQEGIVLLNERLVEVYEDGDLVATYPARVNRIFEFNKTNGFRRDFAITYDRVEN